MKKFSIVTDTDASLPPTLAEKYQIRQVPITIHFDDEVYATGVDIDDAKLFSKIEEQGSLPTTAAPSPGKFAETFREAFEQDQSDAIACFVVSGEVSGTYDSALIAANELMPDRDITVVDTLSLSMGQGYMALLAADALANGADIAEAIDIAEKLRDRTYLFGALSTLKFLAMGGRVSHLTAEMAGLLNIKPILTIKDGKLDMLEKVRTRKKAWARILELTAEKAAGKPIEHMSILHTASIDDALQLKQQLEDALPCPSEIHLSELTPGLSVHTGPGFVGVVFVVGE
ncbi:DegV family protein [bacterium]|nr:DegV family protein [bacterium]